MSDDWNSFSSPVAPAQPKTASASGGDYDSFSSPVAGATPAPEPIIDRPTEIAQAQAQATQLLHAGKEKEALALLAQHNLAVSPGEMEAFHQGKRTLGFTHKDTPPQTDPTLGDYVKGAAENIGRGAVHTLGFIDDAINPFKSPFDNGGPGFFEKNAGDVYDSAAGVRAPKNALQRYVNATSQGIGGALVPLGEMNTVRGALGTLSAGAAGGIGSQAGADAFPGNVLAPQIGALLGAHVGGTPFALKPVRDNAYLNDASAHPEAAYVPQAVSDLANKAADVAPNGLTPRGRGKLTVSQINAVAKQHLAGMPEDLTRLVDAGKLDPETARTLKLAVQNKDGITAPEIAALRGTPEGDAVAEALNHYRAVSNLTKPYGGDGRGVVSKAWNAGVKYLLPVPKVIGDALTFKPGDVNAARIRGADKAIDRKPLFDQLAARVGPSPVGPALDSFHQRVADTFSQQAEADASAADAKASRFGMTDNQFANYSARSSGANDALSNPPVPKPRSKTVQSALNKYQKTADTSSGKLGQFDEALNAPSAPPKRSPEDLAIQNNMDQGLKGYHRAYADSISSHLGVQVQPADVLAALKKVDVSDVDPFQLRKFEMEHKVSPAAKAALLPRLENVLRNDKGVMERPVPETVQKTPQTSDKPKSAAVPSTNVEQLAATPPQPEAAPSTGDYRPVKRRPEFEAARARYQADFDAERARLTQGHSQEIVQAASSGLDHIRNKEKTVESALRYFDEDLGPELRTKHDFDAQEISDLRKDVERMARAGKPYKTDAEFERGAKVGRRGRPRNQTASEDVPF